MSEHSQHIDDNSGALPSLGSAPDAQGAGQPVDTPSMTQDERRQPDVVDALSYLDTVKKTYSERPSVYNQFLDIMKQFQRKELNAPDVIERVIVLFADHLSLIEGFSMFLPDCYHLATWYTSSSAVDFVQQANREHAAQPAVYDCGGSVRTE
ncbi:PAH2 domain-containing protein [Auricularia subglabra TFB-10046 SS5]|nr:PAH2 domain-containing protein [Auricularia subglabra TFB-10046 SS5]